MSSIYDRWADDEEYYKEQFEKALKEKKDNKEDDKDV